MATDPVDYLAGLGGIRALPGSYATTQAVQNNALQQQAAQQQLAMGNIELQRAQFQQQQQQADNAAFNDWFGRYQQNPNDARLLAEGMTRFPQRQAGFKAAWDLRDTATQKADLAQLGAVESALSNNRPDIAIQSMEARIQAEKAAGQPTDEDERLVSALKSGDDNAQKAILGTLRYRLAAVVPDKFGSTLTAVGGDKGANTHVIGAGGALVDDSGRELYRAPEKPTYLKAKNADKTESIIQVGGGGSSGAPASAGASSLPLTTRLNNPGAIRFDPKNQWQGQVGQQNGFVQFDTPEAGAAAHRRLIANQINAGYNTPLAWAQHYAPASDGNDPQAYAKTIADGLGIGVNDKIPVGMVGRVAALSAGVEAGGTPASGAAPTSNGANPALGPKVLYTSKAGSPQDLLSPEEVNFYAEKVANGADLPPLGMGKDAAVLRRQILAKAADVQMNRGITGGQSNLLHSQLKANTQSLAALSKVQNFVNASEQTASWNADQVLHLAPSNVGGSIPIFNRWIQSGRQNVIGDGNLSRFNLAIDTLANEYAKVMTTSTGTGGTTSDSARAEAHRLINNAQTFDQLQGTIKQMKIDMGNRKAALARQNDILSGNIGNAANNLNGGGVSPQGGQETPTRTATNPKTGERIGLINGRWVPIR